MPEIATSTVSPRRIHTGGVRTAPPSPVVPVTAPSPRTRLVKAATHSISVGMSNTKSEMTARCISRPSSCVTSICDAGSVNSSQVTIHGLEAPLPTKLLPGVNWTLRHCQSRKEPTVWAA